MAASWSAHLLRFIISSTDVRLHHETPTVECGLVGQHLARDRLGREPRREVDNRAVVVAEAEQHLSRTHPTAGRDRRIVAGTRDQLQRDRGGHRRLTRGDHHLVADALDDPTTMERRGLEGSSLEGFDRRDQLGRRHRTCVFREADEIDEPDSQPNDLGGLHAELRLTLAANRRPHVMAKHGGEAVRQLH